VSNLTGHNSGRLAQRYVYTIQQTANEETIMTRVEVNKQAPEFTAPDMSGNSVSLSDFTDRLNVLLIFNRSFS